jgi:hypothetical protein
MLTNFILDTDLVNQFTKVMSYLPAGQTTYAPKIALAYELVLSDLRTREIEPRLIHLPIDLNRDYNSTATYNQSIPLTVTASGNSNTYALGITGFRRFIINVSSFTGTSIAFTLQGSNDILTNNSLPVNWNTITSLSFTTTGTKSIVYDVEYQYYRALWVVVGPTPSITFTAGILETCFDQLIIQKSFMLIFQDMSKDTNDIWYDYMKRSENNYEAVLQSVKYVYDENGDNIPNVTEKRASQTRFSR